MKIILNLFLMSKNVMLLLRPKNWETMVANYATVTKVWIKPLEANYKLLQVTSNTNASSKNLLLLLMLPAQRALHRRHQLAEAVSELLAFS